MKKFNEIYKEKLNEAEIRKENKVLSDFKLIYKAMLENYNISSVKDLDEDSQLSFLTELSYYWDEENGLSEKGKNFLKKRDTTLNENSTVTQKKNYLKSKSYVVINETFKQANFRKRVYDVIDEMYYQLKASDLSDILSPDTIVSIVNESLNKVSKEFINEIYNELKENYSPKVKLLVKPSVDIENINEREFSTTRRKVLAKEGKALPDGSFPIVTVEDLKNAIKSYGRAKNKEKAKAHIKKRAKQMGKYDLIPDSWK